MAKRTIGYLVLLQSAPCFCENGGLYPLDGQKVWAKFIGAAPRASVFGSLNAARSAIATSIEKERARQADRPVGVHVDEYRIVACGFES